MSGFFRRLKLAVKAFFAILFGNHLPDDVAAEYGRASAPKPEPGPAVPAAAASPAPTAAQVLAVLQRDGRLIDFLMEDIAPYADAQIGAAARDVHDGCRQALQRYVSLAPALNGEEGGSVTIAAGTDAATVKLVGNVAGQPPYRGVLRHRGWIVSRMDLPSLPATGQSVIAPAEVEIV